MRRGYLVLSHPLCYFTREKNFIPRHHMSVFHKFLLLFLLGLVCFCPAFSGCRGEAEPEGMPKRHPATIQLTQAGEPCEGASVRLIAESQNNWSVGGSTDATGTVTLQTYGKYPGAPEGKYKVVVTKIEREIAADSGSMYDSKGETSYDLIDPVYSSPEGTPLEIEVKSGKNAFGPFDLGEKIRQKVKPPGM